MAVLITEAASLNAGTKPVTKLLAVETENVRIASKAETAVLFISFLIKAMMIGVFPVPQRTKFPTLIIGI